MNSETTVIKRITPTSGLGTGPMAGSVLLLDWVLISSNWLRTGFNQYEPSPSEPFHLVQ